MSSIKVNRVRLAAVTAVLLSVVYLAGQSSSLTRGPYLQVGTPSSVVVRWRTTAPVVGRVQVPQFGAEEINTITTVLIAGAFAIAVGYGYLRARREGVFPGVQVAGAMLAAFLLFNKVHSPQYTLWLLPFFVMIAVNVWWWAAYAVVDLSVYVGVFRWFHDFGITGSVEQSTWSKELMIAGVWGRAGLLAVLFFLFLFARRAPSPTVSHPPASVEPEKEPETQANLPSAG